jgi:hypothetical protein
MIFVGFRHGQKWTQKFLKKGFGHCAILVPFEKGWLELDPACNVLGISEISDKDVLKKYTVILRLDTKDEYNNFPLKFCSCVTIVEYALGCNLKSFTPYRLYKKLIGKYKDVFKTEIILGG